MLPTSGSVLFNRTTRQHGLVLQVSDAGVLLWKINSTRCGSQRLWYFDSDDGTNFVHVAITNEADWFCVDSRGVQPKQLAALIQQKKLSQPPDIQDAIVGIGVGEAKQPLLKYSCSKGFRSLTVPHLKLLWRRLKVTTSAPPQTTGPLLKGVAEHVLGTEVVLEELLARRERKQYTEIPTPLTAEMLEQCAEAISEQDHRCCWAAKVPGFEFKQCVPKAAAATGGEGRVHVDGCAAVFSPRCSNQYLPRDTMAHPMAFSFPGLPFSEFCKQDLWRGMQRASNNQTLDQGSMGHPRKRRRSSMPLDMLIAKPETSAQTLEA